MSIRNALGKQARTTEPKGTPRIGGYLEARIAPATLSRGQPERTRIRFGIHIVSRTLEPDASAFRLMG